MNMMRAQMILEAVTAASKANDGINVDGVSRYLPDDFGLEIAELQVVTSLPHSQLEPETPVPQDADVLRKLIRVSVLERIEISAHINGLRSTIQTKRAAVATALQTFAHGRQKTDYQIRKEYMEDEQRKRIDQAAGRGAPVRSDPEPRDYLTRLARAQKHGLGGQRGGNFRRAPPNSGGTVFPAGMRGAKITTDPLTGRRTISRSR